MHLTPFPSLGTPVSRLCYGSFGLKGVFGAFDRTEAIDSLHYCWSLGVNFLDTARHYGEADEIVAEALRAWSGPRPFIATKAEHIGPVLAWGSPTIPIEACFPPGHITKQAEDSLRILGVDVIDLFQLHLYWANWGLEGYWLDELEALKSSGKIRAIGVSLPDQRHDVALPLVLSGRIDAVQTILNIFDSTALDCLAPICAQKKVAVLARCVLDEGGLTGFLTPDTVFGDGDFRARYFDAGPRSPTKPSTSSGATTTGSAISTSPKSWAPHSPTRNNPPSPTIFLSPFFCQKLRFARAAEFVRKMGTEK